MTDTIDDVAADATGQEPTVPPPALQTAVWRLRCQAIARPAWPAPITPVSSSRSGDALWNVFS
jgi:hypothetical protein